ncbi:hypothetical protein BH24ACT5_BH24ACT5_29680 [soil metagenome]
MLPTGFRFLLAATMAAIAAAILYGIGIEGSIGTVGLISVAIALGIVAGVVLYVRDADVSAMSSSALTDSPAARRPPRPSMWPLVAGLGGLLVVIGLVTYPVVLIFGVVALLAAVVEWMVAAWSERASGDDRYNVGVRERTAHPAEFPVLAALIGAVVIYSFSRIMLFLSKSGGPVVFGAVAAVLLAVGFLLAYRPTITPAAKSAVAGVALVGLVAGGVAAALAGEREIHPHETTSDLAAEGGCSSPEETEVDENASQTVGAKANIAAEIILTENGTLVARALGIPVDADHLTVTRSNPTSIRFRNRSDEERRLVLTQSDSATDVTTDGTTNEATDATTNEQGTVAATDEDDSGPLELCTTLVEHGGSQFLTFELPQSSSDAIGYEFTVPGVDTARVEVRVP